MATARSTSTPRAGARARGWARAGSLWFASHRLPIRHGVLDEEPRRAARHGNDVEIAIVGIDSREDDGATVRRPMDVPIAGTLGRARLGQPTHAGAVAIHHVDPAGAAVRTDIGDPVPVR